MQTMSFQLYINHFTCHRLCHNHALHSRSVIIVFRIQKGAGWSEITKTYRGMYVHGGPPDVIMPALTVAMTPVLSLRQLR